ncbi:MAG: type II secretion system protein GspN [Desulfamplus sp.]|nr:type II secretion system protein GspN [Desulfamplus sp.]
MRIKHILFYAAYSFAAFFIFLILLFPKEKVANIVCEKVNSKFVDGQIVMQSLAPSFPLSLKAINTSILLNDGNEVKIDSIILSPQILSLYKSIKKIDVKAEAYGGNIDGVIDLGKVTESGKIKDLAKPLSTYDVNVAITFQNLNIQNLKHTVEKFDIFSSFIMSGKLNYSTLKAKMGGNVSGNGNGIIALSNCVVKSDNIFLKQMGIEKVSFTDINIKWDKSEDIVNVAVFDAKGSDIKIKLAGEILLKKPVDISTLDLKGEFQPTSANITSIIAGLSGLSSLNKLLSGSAKKGISFKITGTLQRPIVTPLI